MFESLFTFSAAEIAALILSAKVAVFCTLLIAIPGVAVAWLLARKSFFGKSVLDSVVHMPLVLPPVVPGFLLLLVLGSQGIIGKWLNEAFGITIAFTWIGAVVASAVMAFPLMVRSARLAISQVDSGLEKAAQSLGAHPFKVFWTVTLPLVHPATATVIILSFIGGLRSFDMIWAMTKGGPGFTSDVIASVIYKQYQAGFYGLSTAGNVVLFIMVALIIVPLSMLLNRQETDR